MANNLPQFSPTGGEGSTYQEFIFQNGQWVVNPAFTAPTTPPVFNPGIVSTTNYRDALSNIDTSLSDFSNDPYMKMFADLKAKNQQFEETARLNAEAQANREKVQQDQRYAGRSAGVVSSNIAGGLSRYAPELANSAVQQAYNENYQKVQDIQAAEDLAIAKAKEARAANDLDVAKEQLDYVQQLRKAKAEAIADAQKMAFEREKFERNYALDVQRERRLSSGSASALDYTDLELKKLREAGINPKNVKMADNYLYGENKGIVPPRFTRDTVDEFGGIPKLWNLALALGIRRDKNLSKKDEVDRLFADQDLVDYIQQMTDEGVTIDEIIASQ